MGKKVLIRAKISPFVAYDAEEALTGSYTGNNSGNLLFAYSVSRLMFTKDQGVDYLNDDEVMCDDYDVEHINQEYAALVLPMANSFRKSFMKPMQAWTRLIKQLTIPVVVVGIGIQEESGVKIGDPRAYDDTARDFVAAVLEHSASMGVRGSVTQAYLNHLGFSDIDVIGCPSFALGGPELKIRDALPLTPESAVTITGSSHNPECFKDFVAANIGRVPNYYFIPQYNEDLRLMIQGVSLPNTKTKWVKYPHSIDHEVFKQDKARFFIDIKSMLEFNASTQFNFGTRIHGCVANLVVGVPSLLFPTDARIQELADYHNIPVISATQVDASTNLLDLYEKVDFHQVEQGAEQRFWHLMDFLDTNGLEHVWKDRKQPQVFPAEELLAATPHGGPVRSLWSLPQDEQMAAIARGHAWMAGKQLEATNERKLLAAEKKKLVAENKKLVAENKKLKASLKKAQDAAVKAEKAPKKRRGLFGRK